MAYASNSNRSVGIVSILAMILAVSTVWFSWGCSGSSQKPAATNTSTTSAPSDDDDDDVHVKVDLPDTVTIKP